MTAAVTPGFEAVAPGGNGATVLSRDTDDAIGVLNAVIAWTQRLGDKP
jgi:hypothetical protein